uniref:G-protein coupled receptors family 1 profile domain-containing protein n=1 Tax=Romanomermis culicivorax TaxID=13658 RepID=A0A915KSL0_ROMCU
MPFCWGETMTINDTSNQESCQPSSDEILVVWLVAILTAIHLLPYLICVIHMAKDRKLLEKQPFYLLAVNLGVADIVQILFNGPGVIFLTLTCQEAKFGRTQFFLNSSIGAVLNSAWEVECP